MVSGRVMEMRVSNASRKCFPASCSILSNHRCKVVELVKRYSRFYFKPQPLLGIWDVPLFMLPRLNRMASIDRRFSISLDITAAEWPGEHPVWGSYYTQHESTNHGVDPYRGLAGIAWGVYLIIVPITLLGGLNYRSLLWTQWLFRHRHGWLPWKPRNQYIVW